MTNFLKNPIFITLAVIVAGTVGLITLMRPGAAPTNSASYVERFWGKEDAKITVTEYGDLMCEGCLNFFENVEPKLKEKYKDQIKFVFKHFPLTSAHHRYSQNSAEATEAAGAQGKFWEYHDLLYSRQAAETQQWTDAKLVSYAQELGLDVNRFEKELKENMYEKLVKDSVKEALDKGYDSTPSVEVNGKKIENPTFENIEKEIQSLFESSESK